MTRTACANAWPRSNRMSTRRILIEVVVIDNGSRDASAAVAAQAGALVLSRPGDCVASLRNDGVTAATGDIVAFVDADHLLGPDWVESAARLFQDDTVAGTGALCLAPASGTWVQAAFDRLRSRVSGVRDVEWLGAGNLAFRRRVFQEVGGFDTPSRRARASISATACARPGYRLVSDDRLRNVHMGDPETLRALFFSELWRGRDNIRVTFRGPLTVRALPSVVIPVFNLGCLAARDRPCGAPWGGLWVSAIRRRRGYGNG